MAGVDVHAEADRKVYTYQDYLQFPDDGIRYEIIDGEVFISPAPTLDHQRVVGRLFAMIWDFLEETPLGEVFPAPSDVIFSGINILQPDIVYVSRERSAILMQENIQGAPDLLIEVLSPGTEDRDRTSKREKYSQFGVREYWMVSPEEGTIEVWRKENDELSFCELYRKNQTLTTPLLPGLEIQLKRVFRNL